MAKWKRGNGEGTAFRVKGRNLWRATISFKDQNGRSRRISRFGKTKTEALNKVAELQTDKREGTILTPDQKKLSDSVNDWLEYSAREKVSLTTFKRYEGLIKNHIDPLIGREKLQKITPDHVQYVLESMKKKKLSASSRRQCYSVMNQTFKQEIIKRTLKFNPCDAVQCPSMEHTEFQVLTKSEVLRFFKEARKTRLYAFYVIAVTTGMRLGEMLGLKWDDLNWKTESLSVQRKVVEIGGKISIGKPKTRSSKRNVLLSKMAITSLHEHRKLMLAEGNSSSEWIFCNTKGGLSHPRNVRIRSFKPLLKKAGLPDIRLHDLRHTSATLLLEAGEHPKVVQERLGHSKTSVTMDIYSHVLPTMQEKAAWRFDEMLGS